MKILMVAHGFPPELVGGTETYMAALSRELKQRGHELHIFAGSIAYEGKLVVQDSEFEGIPVRRVVRGDLYFDSWDKAYNPRVSALFEEQMERVQPDLVHIHHWIRLSSNLARIAKRMGAWVVGTLHDFYLTCPRAFRIREEVIPCDRELEPDQCRHCVPRWRFQGDIEIDTSINAYRSDVVGEIGALDLALAPSKSHADALRGFQPGLKDKIEVVPHPFLHSLEESRPSEEGPLRICCWSHLHHLKGQDVLLEAVRQLPDPSAVRVELLGGSFVPDFRAKLDRLAEGLDVEFLGEFSPPDLSGRTMDLIVVPSRARESYSFVFDEAARLGAPMIVSRTGALSERASERVIYVEPSNPVALRDAIQRLIDEPERRSAMREAPSPPVLDIGAHGDRIEALYQSLAHSSPEVPRSPKDDTSSNFERLCREWDRREQAFQELVRSDNWEGIMAEKNRLIEDQERQIQELSQKLDHRGQGA